MNRAAGYRSDEPGVPNLPGYRHTQNYMAMSQPRRSSLKFVRGFPIVEDIPDVQPHSVGLSSTHTARPKYDFSDQGGPIHTPPPPLAYLPPNQDQLQLQQSLMAQQQQQASLQPPSTANATLGSTARLSTSRGTLQWTGVKTPGWLLYDRKVLRFHAYSCDRVLYSPTEEVRVRHFDLYYHMEDGSVEMVEPQAENSGLVQGKYLNRHRAKLPNNQPLTHNELRVGTELVLYSRKFMITGCDAATRAFYAELGQPQQLNFSAPEDQYELVKKAAKAADELRRTNRCKYQEDDLFDGDLLGPGAIFKFEEDTSKQDQLDGKVLRFYACWDDTKSTFGQKLPFVIYYYLKNDTLEVAEHHLANTGRDPFPLLLRRCQLPKTPNVPPVGGRPMSPKTKRSLNIQYYNWREMCIGSVVYVYSRPLVIYDMDNYTRSWMAEQGGLNPAELQPIPIDFDMGPKRPPLQVPPDMLNIGAEEDSRRNVLSLVPKPPPFDPVHFMENWNKVLRFSARMVPVRGRPLMDPRDAQRRFIISYFLLDQTISIFEPRKENTGIPGGKFLERIKVKKEGEEGYLTDDDLQIGKVVPIFARCWELLDADNNTCKYMEVHKEKYPHADYDKVMDKVCSALGGSGNAEEDLRQVLIEEDSSGLGYVTKQQLQAAMVRAGVPLTLHEATTIVRALGADLLGVVCEQLLLAIQAHNNGSVGGIEEGRPASGNGGYQYETAPSCTNMGGAGMVPGYENGVRGANGAGAGYGAYSGARNAVSGAGAMPVCSSGDLTNGAAGGAVPGYRVMGAGPSYDRGVLGGVPAPRLMPGYGAGDPGPLNDPAPVRPGPRYPGYGDFRGAEDAAGCMAAAGGPAQVGGVPYHRPRMWKDPSPDNLHAEVHPGPRQALPSPAERMYYGGVLPQQQPAGEGQYYGGGRPQEEGVGMADASAAAGGMANANRLAGLENGGLRMGYYVGAQPQQPSSSALSGAGCREEELSLRGLNAAWSGARDSGQGPQPLGGSQDGAPRQAAWADDAAGGPPYSDVGLHQDQRMKPITSDGPTASSRPSNSSNGDPRFCAPPGGIGYTGTSKAGPPNPNRSSLDVISKVKQPSSLWQTSNQAIGGIHHPSSSRPSTAVSWNRRSHA